VAISVQGVQNGMTQVWDNQNLVGGLEDQFLKILLTQLKYQDPMAPMEEKDFFAQMAQFSTATQIQDLNNKVSVLCEIVLESEYNKALLEATHLIGKEFEAAFEDGYFAGVVEGVGFASGRLVVHSGEYYIPIENIVWIGG
jgi:flagellar basal-body rod modification protein FlgD